MEAGLCQPPEGHTADMANPLGVGRLKSWTFQSLGSGRFSAFDAVPDSQDSSETFPSSVIRVGDVHYVSFDDLARFAIDFSSETITAFDVGAETTTSGLTHLLYDHVLPRIIAHCGELVLHGSAVEIDGRLAVFLGDTGAGKSTLAASLHSAGHRLLGDDAVVISRLDGRYAGESVYPSLRLYPEAIAAVLGKETESAPMAHYSEKQKVSLSEPSDTEGNPVPISAFFYLTAEIDDGPPAAYELSPAPSCIWLVEQSFSLDPQDPKSAARRLAKVSEIAPEVPGYEIVYPYDFERLGEVHNMIRDCMKTSEQRIANRQAEEAMP